MLHGKAFYADHSSDEVYIANDPEHIMPRAKKQSPNTKLSAYSGSALVQGAEGYPASQSCSTKTANDRSAHTMQGPLIRKSFSTQQLWLVTQCMTSSV